MTIVIKIGGAALEDAATLRKCARAIAELAQDGHRVAVVHGGGTALTRVLKQLGKQSEFIGGLRVTDAETRDVALMVLGGMVNKRMVAAIQAAGAIVTGEITASPGAGQIEVAHRSYHVKADSPAEKTLHHFYLGQVVDLIFNKPAANAEAEVVAIALHPN